MSGWRNRPVEEKERERERTRGWIDIVAVGREGVACRGRRERKKGDFDPLPASGILTEGVLLAPPGRLAFRRAHTCDLRCVMRRRRLMCGAHSPFTLSLSFFFPHGRLLRGRTYVIRTHACLSHDATPYVIRAFTNTFRTSW